MLVEEPQLLVGVSVGLHNIHAIIIREEDNGRLRLMGEYRNRQIAERSDETFPIHRVQKSIQEAIADAQVSPTDILTIGIAVPGQIDIKNGLLLSSPLFHIQEKPFPVVAKLHEYVDTRQITLINNNDAHGIGEQRIGVGKQFKDLVYIRIAYNVGACIIIDEQLYTGEDYLSSEFGHMIVDPNGPECSCGNKGCLNMIVSRSAIEQKLLHLYKEGETTVLATALDKKPLDINSVVIADAIDQEDALTSRVVEEAADALGIGIANVINLLNPQVVILGGDVIDEIDPFFERAVTSARKRLLHMDMRNVSILHGSLGTTAAAYGAAVFAKKHLQHRGEQLKKLI